MQRWRNVEGSRQVVLSKHCCWRDVNVCCHRLVERSIQCFVRWTTEIKIRRQFRDHCRFRHDCIANGTFLLLLLVQTEEERGGTTCWTFAVMLLAMMSNLLAFEKKTVANHPKDVDQKFVNRHTYMYRYREVYGTKKYILDTWFEARTVDLDNQRDRTHPSTYSTSRIKTWEVRSELVLTFEYPVPVLPCST